MLPRAPELTIISMGLKVSDSMPTRMAASTRPVASVQISTSFCRRSPSVMIPRLNWVSTFSASFSYWSRIERFSLGVRTSSIEKVSPDWVA